MLTIDQKILYEQFLNMGPEAGGQLGEEYAEVFQHPVARERLARGLRLHTAAIDEVQLPVMAQQIVQMKVALPEPPGMQSGDRAQRLAQHALLRIGQHRLPFHVAPGPFQALRASKIIEQQPTTLTRSETLGNQRRRGHPLLGQQPCAAPLAVVMALGLAPDQQLRQYLATLPFGFAHIALPWQHTQPLAQRQLTGG